MGQGCRGNREGEPPATERKEMLTPGCGEGEDQGEEVMLGDRGLPLPGVGNVEKGTGVGEKWCLGLATLHMRKW